MSRYILLTGATGLVGRYLIRDLLSAGHRLALLVRPTKKQTAAERVETILQFLESNLDSEFARPVVLEGNVTDEGLGLSDADRAWVANKCDRLIHNAAVLTFHGEDRNDDPWRTNVGGTQKVLDFCKEVGIRDLHYVSTSYVCGVRHDLVHENELDVGQSFRNDYERSKFEAETLVRSADFLDSLTVYRPAVIAGDSVTGYTSTYHGMYHYLKLMSVLVWNTPPGPDGVRHTPVKLEMTGDEPRNIVPVDWVSAVICRLLDTPESHGGTYHITPEVCLTARDLIEAGYKRFNSSGVEFCGKQIAEGTDSEMTQAASANKSIYDEYETSDPSYDTTELRKFTADLPCPKIDEAMIHKFWEYGEEDRWGKRREPQAKVPFWVADYLQEQISASTNGSHKANESDHCQTIGLDVTGPGGGQWTIECEGDQIVAWEPGLPDDGQEIVLMNVNEFVGLIQANTAGKAVATENVAITNGHCKNGELVDFIFQTLLPTT